jgi:hypothetical protein
MVLSDINIYWHAKPSFPLPAPDNTSYFSFKNLGLITNSVGEQVDKYDCTVGGLIKVTHL